MEIKGKVHCFFEQSGTFKNEFVKLGIPAEDYDIQDNFGQTDHVVDLFAEIESAYGGGISLFENITKDDLIIAFFPCIYFCAFSQSQMNWNHKNFKNFTIKEKTNYIINRAEKREYFWRTAVKMISLCKQKGLRIVMENPWSEQTFLKSNFLQPPTVIDENRRIRGDFFVKPTAYWFINCENTNGLTCQEPKQMLTENKFGSSKPVDGERICSEERSMISPDYARNFICDFILGKKQDIGQLSLF